MIDTLGQRAAKGPEGGPWAVKEPQGGPQVIIWNLHYIFLSCRWRAKKKVLGVFKGSFKTYTRYFGVADKDVKKRS